MIRKIQVRIVGVDDGVVTANYVLPAMYCEVAVTQALRADPVALRGYLTGTLTEQAKILIEKALWEEAELIASDLENRES